MKNHYTISDDGLIATIQLKRRSGEIIHCLVDSADLPKLLAFKTTWYAHWDNDTQSFYVYGNVRDERKKSGQRMVSMHRFLMDAPEGLKVDHWNHITTDNRRSNLRIVTNSENLMNRKGATRNSRTGHRGISFHRRDRKFCLRTTIDGKEKWLGYFSTIEDAITARNQFQEYRAEQ